MKLTDEIYTQYGQTVYRYLLSLTHDEHVAEEMTQETFYQAVRSIDRFDGSCRLSTWLCAIAKNQLQSYYRKHSVTVPAEPYSCGDNGAAAGCAGGRASGGTGGSTGGRIRGPAADGSSDTAASAETEALDKMREVEILRHLHQLPEPYRELFYLRVFGNLSFKEIGNIMGKSENWARVSFYRGKEKLRKEIEDEQ